MTSHVTVACKILPRSRATKPCLVEDQEPDSQSLENDASGDVPLEMNEGL